MILKLHQGRTETYTQKLHILQFSVSFKIYDFSVIPAFTWSECDGMRAAAMWYSIII